MAASTTIPPIRAFWEKTSPYQNLRKGVAYPEPFIFTTTKDDRVGPAARAQVRRADGGIWPAFLLL